LAKALTDFGMAAEFVEDNLHGMLRGDVRLDVGRDRLRRVIEDAAEKNASAASAVAEPLARLLEEVYFTFGTEDARPDTNPVDAIEAFARLAERIRVDALPELIEETIALVEKCRPSFAYSALVEVLAEQLLGLLRKERVDDVNPCTDVVLTVLQDAVRQPSRSVPASEALAPSIQRAAELIAGANIELQPQVLLRYIHDRGVEGTLSLMEQKYGLIVGVEFDSRDTSTPRTKIFALDAALLDPDPAKERQRDYSKLAPPAGAVHIVEHALNLRGLNRSKLRSVVELFESACHRASSNLDRVASVLAHRRYAGGQRVQIKSLLDVDSLNRMTARSLRDIEHSIR